jgi:hypothetical protein
MPRGGHDGVETGMGAVARRLLASGAVGDASLRDARVGAALPVAGARGEVHSWFVPLVLGESLAAFVQLLPDGTLMRFSTFARRPAAAEWLEPARIRERAENAARAGETAGDPVLTFDRSPDRLVWAVPLTTGEGVSRRVFVAGESVYEPTPGDSIG